MTLTLHKGMTKRVLPTADFVVAAEPGDLHGVTFDPPYFIKPVAEGTGKGVTPDSIVRRRRDLGAACRNLMAAFQQPVLTAPVFTKPGPGS